MLDLTAIIKILKKLLKMYFLNVKESQENMMTMAQQTGTLNREIKL